MEQVENQLPICKRWTVEGIGDHSEVHRVPVKVFEEKNTAIFSVWPVWPNSPELIVS